MPRPTVISCGGLSLKTGQRVGSRHRWGGGAWGVGRCDFCGRYLEDVLEKPSQELSLDQAKAKGKEVADESAWHPNFNSGRDGSKKGWYVKRSPISWQPEWLWREDGELVRFDTEKEALQASATANAAVVE